MKNKNLILSIAMGLLLANGALAADPKTERDERVINSVTYIEDDADFELGFDTADYLPEDFDPHSIYVDLDAVVFMEEEVMDGFVSKKHLPSGFNAYAYPTDVESMNYIDETDRVEVDFDVQKHLPEGFDPYIKYEK
ncbi:MAG: hypothetical protein WA913_16360 [Pricia sp.]